VDLAGEEQALRISQLLSRLDAEFIGLAPVKDRVREIAALLLIDRLRARYGLSSSRPSLHMCFTGSPGTGKTTVATHMGELLRELGYLRQGQLVSVTRDDLVGQYVGHTAPKTKEVLKRAMGGVLLIDEAYYLYRPENERDYGQESIEILLQFMEAHREDLVVILAGYADRMDTFFRSNPGMASRIAHHIGFPDFTLEELLQIAEKMLEREQYRLSPAAREAFAEYVRLRMGQPRFANARSIRNAIDRLRLRQARRLVTGGGLIARGDLMEISAEDVRASRVFRDAGHPDPTTGPPGDKLTGPPGPPSPGGGGLSGTVSRTVVPRFGEEDSSSLPPSSSARSRMAARPKPVGWLAIAAVPPAAMAPPLAVPMAPTAAGSKPVPSSATSSTILSRCR
jgi:probable Rubsico expression protein CbbX